MGRVNIYVLLGDGATFKRFHFMFLILENIQLLYFFKFDLISLYSFIVVLHDKLWRNGVVHFISLIFRK